MSAISTRLPAWLQRHGVTGLCLLVVLLITLSLTRQGIDLLRLLRSPPAAEAGAGSAEPQPVSLQRLQYLFGTPALAPGEAGNAPPTTQRITLLASFVGADSARSSAIIQIAGDKPRRVAVGEAINASTRLRSVHQDHIVLDRDGREESLHFPAARQSSPGSTPPASVAEQLEQLQNEDVQALQERIQTLQQRMEGEGDTPPPDEPEVEESP